MMAGYVQFINHILSRATFKEKFAYFTIVAISVGRLYTEAATADIYILKVLLQKNLSILIYIIGILVSSFFVYKFKKPLSNIKHRDIIKYIIIFLVVVSTFSFLVGTYPPIDNGVDHDEATEAWIDALLEGEYPYNPEAHSEYDVAELTVFPSIPLLALPFYLIADVAVLTVLGVLLISMVFRRESRSERKCIMALTALLLSVPLHFRVLAHSNYIHLIALFVVGFHFLRKEGPIIAGILFGILFAAKTNAWPLLPVVGIAILDKWNLQHSIVFFISSSIIGFGIIIPFILWNPEIFFNIAPLGVTTGHTNTFGLSTTVFAAIVVFASVSSYAYNRNLITALIIGSFTLLLGYPGRYQLFLSVFVVMWAFLQLILIIQIPLV